MAERKYEKYVVTKADRPKEFFDPMAKGFMTQPPLIFLNGDKPIQGANQFLEVVWVFDEGAAAINPHSGGNTLRPRGLSRALHRRYRTERRFLPDRVECIYRAG